MALLCACVLTAIFVGWRSSDEGNITAESGLGYTLGIMGSVMMLLLLLYPLRKRVRGMRGLGRVPLWFRLHMIVGVIGPTLVIIHSNFKLGSANGTVALFSMLAVVASGFVGRFLYSRIHRGLYGRKMRVHELLSDAGEVRAVLRTHLADFPTVMERLTDYETQKLRSHPNLAEGLWFALFSSIRTRRERRNLLAQARGIMRQRAATQGWTFRERRRRLKVVETHLSNYFDAVGTAATFSLYERLFALWHVLHLPLFFLLVVAACVHVIAVHLY